jgi:hypothetical protein
MANFYPSVIILRGIVSRGDMLVDVLNLLSLLYSFHLFLSY